MFCRRIRRSLNFDIRIMSSKEKILRIVNEIYQRTDFRIVSVKSLSSSCIEILNVIFFSFYFVSNFILLRSLSISSYAQNCNFGYGSVSSDFRVVLAVMMVTCHTIVFSISLARMRLGCSVLFQYKFLLLLYRLVVRRFIYIFSFNFPCYPNVCYSSSDIIYILHSRLTDIHAPIY